MNISNEGINLIKMYESCRLTAYQDAKGVWTIGYGHTANVKRGQVISQETADIFLREDIKKAERYVNSYNPLYNFTQAQFDALTSFTYNCGGGNLKNLLNGGQRTIYEVSEAIPYYNKSGGKILNGLVKRRQAEKAMFDRGIVKKSVNEIAKEVLKGKWGNGNDRRQRLIKAGYDYDEVQAEVNRIAKR